MVGIAVISHGKLCDGIVDSVRMVAGDIEQMETVSLKPGMTSESYLEILKAAVERVDTGDGVLVLTDILGGTPFNSIVRLTQEKNLGIVTGMNMPMLVCASLDREEDDTVESLMEKVEEAGTEGIKTLRR